MHYTIVFAKPEDLETLPNHLKFPFLIRVRMSMMVSFVLSFFPRDVLDEILKLIESVSEDFPSYSLGVHHIIH